MYNSKQMNRNENNLQTNIKPIESKERSSTPHNKLWRMVKTIIAKMRGYFPITSMGVVYISLLILTFIYIALAMDDIVWVTSALALLCIGCLMIIAVVIGSISTYIAWKKHLEESHSDISVQCSFSTPTDLELSIWPIPFIEVETKCLYPPHVELDCRQTFTQVREYATAQRRCNVEYLERLITVKDILGLAAVSWQTKENIKFKAFPAPGKIQRSSITVSMSNGEDLSDPFGSPKGDLIEMRKYTPGDSSRNILWKIYARSRKLVVRMPENALTAKPRTCAYLISGIKDEASAGLARVILESNLLGANWCFGADGCNGTVDTIAGALEFLATSGNPENECCNLQKFLIEAGQKGYHSCFVFVPSSYGKWINIAQQAAKSSHLAITWLIGFDSVLEKLENDNKWEKYIYKDVIKSEEDPSRVAMTLGSKTTPVVLCERSTGRIINDAQNYFRNIRRAV